MADMTLDAALAAHAHIRSIGGSDIKRIAAGDWQSLWLEKTGRKAVDDLTWELPVQIGTALEPVIRRFFEHQIGSPILTSERDLCNMLGRQTVTGADGRVSVIHPDIEWAIASLDGGIPATLPPSQNKANRLFEAKTCSYWLATKNRDTLIAKHMPQIQWYMLVTDVMQTDMVFPVDNLKLDCVNIHFDAGYAFDLLGQAEKFWWHIVNDVMPEEGAPVAKAPPAPFLGERIDDMTGSNAWADAAGRWLEHTPHVALAEEAAEALKLSMPAEAKIAEGHGVRLTRNKRGAITISIKD